ncbi:MULTISPECIES: Sec-independent protein translocase protein TatB [unclassified Lysobacter]
MFDIGFSELFVVAIVALLVLGPERLPRAARFAGLWVRRARAQWYSVKSELERELADEELKSSLRKTQDELRDARDQLQASGEGLRRDLQHGRDIAEREWTQATQAQPSADHDSHGSGQPAPGGDQTHDEPYPGEPGPPRDEPAEPEHREPGPAAPARREPDPVEPDPVRRDPPSPDKPVRDPSSSRP